MKKEKRDTAASRAVVEDQLMVNLLTLAIHYKRDSDSGMAYFDQSIIRPDEEAADEPQPPA